MLLLIVIPILAVIGGVLLVEFYSLLLDDESVLFDKHDKNTY